MKTKEFLSQAFHIDMAVKAKLFEVQRLNELARATSSVFSETPRHKGQGSRVEEAVVRIVDLEDEIATDISRLVDVKRRISEAIKTVGDIQCEAVLSMRYLSYMKWEEIAAEYDCGLDNIYHMHRKGLSLVRIQ